MNNNFRNRNRALLALAATLLLLPTCQGEPPNDAPLPPSKVTTDRDYLRDAHGRYLFVHGINVSGSTKVPASIDGKPLTIADLSVPNTKGVPSYVGKPFPAGELDAEMRKLQSAGFNVIRLLVNWEGLEPVRKGVYDQDYLKSIRATVESANRHGMYVLLDMHQDMFSRHLVVRYNEKPSFTDPKTGLKVEPAKGSLENTILSLVPPYTDAVRGEGAPRWVVEACLQEKNLDAPTWGTPRILSGLDAVGLSRIWELYQKLLGKEAGPAALEPWVVYLLTHLPGQFPVTDTSDVLPFTNWGVAASLSLDVERCFGCLLAGDVAFPGLTVDECQDVPLPADPSACQAKQTVTVQTHLQDAFADAWVEVAKQVKDLPNVIGYDLINEPIGNFLVLTAVGGLLQTGTLDGAQQTLVALLGKENGELVFDVLNSLRLLPPIPPKPTDPALVDAWQAQKQATLHEWGLDKLDLLAIAGLNVGFDRNHLKPFYEKVGKAILTVDPQAVFFLEPTMNISALLGGKLGSMWDQSMNRPDGLERVVWAPHYYADIYPFLGFNAASRVFTADEVQYRNYQPFLEGVAELATFALGNAPVVFGEFGTYFNFGGIEASVAQNYLISEHILDNYFEAFERMFENHMLWCYTPDNDKQYGDLWNKEDFSIQGFDGKFRGARAWARPYAKAMAGKPISTHFWSPLHYFDPKKGTPNPQREFEVTYESKETDAPTEIFVPTLQYPDGFYVWLSDGRAWYDPETQTLSHLPAADQPDAVHSVRILPPLPDREATGWQYFFRDHLVLTGD
jgi:hypothetical protein